jgi:hypothetical protein
MASLSENLAHLASILATLEETEGAVRNAQDTAERASDSSAAYFGDANSSTGNEILALLSSQGGLQGDLESARTRLGMIRELIEAHSASLQA